MHDERTGTEGVILGTDAAGVLILTPCGPLEDAIAQTLLRIVTTAVSLGTEAVTVDLRSVDSYTPPGVQAVRCCRRLAARSTTTIRFLTGGNLSQQLLLDSYADEEQLPPAG